MRSDYPTEKTHPIDSVATSEMSSGLKTGSIVALIASVIGPLWASLALNPVSNVTASQTSTVEETAPVEVVETPIEPIATTPAPTLTPEPEITTTPDAGLTTAPTVGLTPDPTSTASPDSLTTTPTPSDTVISPSPTVSPTAATPISSDTTTSATTTTSSPIPEATGSPTIDSTATPAVTASPTPATETTTASAAVDVSQLSQTVYDTIDSEWTKKATPVTAESVYTIEVAPDGAIAKVEPQSQAARDNLKNTPLPELQKTGSATAGETTKFEVKFTDNGLLEINPQ